MLTADDIIEQLDMRPHPEGGHYVETWRDDASTAIYFLLRDGQRSHWHRIDRSEMWHYYAGAPLLLEVSVDGDNVESHHLGADLAIGQRPQATVPPGAWQSARTLGEWTLVGCTVAPPFRFEGFELAAADWHPTGTTRPA